MADLRSEVSKYMQVNELLQSQIRNATADEEAMVVETAEAAERRGIEEAEEVEETDAAQQCEAPTLTDSAVCGRLSGRRLSGATLSKVLRCQKCSADV